MRWAIVPSGLFIDAFLAAVGLRKPKKSRRDETPSGRFITSAYSATSLPARPGCSSFSHPTIRFSVGQDLQKSEKASSSEPSYVLALGKQRRRPWSVAELERALSDSFPSWVAD